MNSYKNITCIDLVNVNIALNSHACEEFYTRVHGKICVFCCSLNPLNRSTYLQSHHDCTRFVLNIGHII